MYLFRLFHYTSHTRSRDEDACDAARIAIRIMTERGPRSYECSLLQVTPSDRSQQDVKPKESEVGNSAEGAWTAGPEFSSKSPAPDEGLNKIEDFNRIGSNKSLSRSKRVKSFIQKKCKDISNSFGSNHGEDNVEQTATVLPRSKSTSRANSEMSTTSWYVANDYHSDDEVFDHVTVVAVDADVRDPLNVSTVAVGEPVATKEPEPDTVEVCCDNVDSRTEGGTDEAAGGTTEEDDFVLAQESPHKDEVSEGMGYCSSEETLIDESANYEVTVVPPQIPEVSPFLS